MNAKELFKSNPALYRIWFFLLKNRINNGEIVLPSSENTWYFDGYPRSGNTFYKGLLMVLYPELEGASHLHCIAGLKLADKEKLKSVIIIRHPIESVSSFYYTKTHRYEGRKKLKVKLLSELLREWINYYTYILTRANICVIEFSPSDDKIVENVREIEDFLSLKTLSDADLISKIEKHHESFKGGENNKELAYSSLPKKERTEFKETVKSQLQSLPEFAKAVKIFDTLISQ